MPQVKIVTDSTADLSLEEIRDLDIKEVPLTINIASESYVDGIDITKQEFLKKMAKSPVLPKTAQPSLGRFIDVLDPLVQAGHPIVLILISDRLSGTIQAAEQAKAMLKGNITIINSHSISRGLARQVLCAGQLAKDGASVDEIVKAVKEVQAGLHLRLDVLELKNLIKGGRIGQVQGFAANLLNIKLFLSLDENGINIVSKVRGTKKLQKEFENLMDKLDDIRDDLVCIDFSHAGLNDFNKSIIEEAHRRFPSVPSVTCYTSPVVATHTGPDALAITIVTKHPHKL
ncbi:DegV family protein [Atopobacter sp. AH10]|uniref:DegV family protein n=1 Tax=Atopobacter sp. AH10 TaxID=2315861 RepID=UPI0013141908|nr:DegV family protein [Atopobacter sp. AH10]